ncbi:hypothetical protein ACFQGW_00085 [Xanthomonas theicola]|uniref:hypothetical protein n=1 Tax=Xanthomonas theicola TaxID=56464 RepID=UPI003612A0FD
MRQISACCASLPPDLPASAAAPPCHLPLALLIQRLRLLHRVVHRRRLLRHVRGGAQAGRRAGHPHLLARHLHAVDLARLGDALVLDVAPPMPSICLA